MATTLNTTILVDAGENPADIDARSIIIAVKEFPAGYQRYSDEELYDIAYWLVEWSKVFRFRCSVVAGQVLHETGNFRFGGDVQANQYNFAGLGATGGVQGARFDSIRDGTLAVYAHHCAYVYGENVPEPLRGYLAIDTRFSAVIQSGHAGKVATIGDYTNGRWAFSRNIPVGSLDNGYAYALRDYSNKLLGITARNSSPLQIAVNAGHRNKSGGNELEAKQTALITSAFVRKMRALGHDIRCAQDHDGLGTYAGDYNDWANQCVRWHEQSVNRWQLDYYLSFHTEGNSAGDAARGCFAILPDATEEPPDTEIRDWCLTVATKIKEKTGIPLRGNGVMSEQNTGAKRLGEYRNTFQLAQFAVRSVIEFGSHSSPADLAIQNKPEFPQQCADAVIESIAAFGDLSPDIPNPPQENTRYFPETGKTAGHGFLAYWESFGDSSIPLFGYPITEEFKDHDGITKQYYQRARFEHRPEYTGNQWNVQLGLLGNDVLDKSMALESLRPQLEKLRDDSAATLALLGALLR